MTSSKPGPRPVPPPQGGAARAPNAYSRFIPREELAGFASWTPDTFAGTADPDAAINPSVAARHAAADRRQGGDRRKPPDPAAAATPPVPPAPPAEEWLAQVQAARQAGYQDGYRDGLEALEAAKRQFASQVSAQMVPLVAAFHEQIEALESRMAQAVTDTALTLARQVVRSELTQRREVVVQVAQEAISAVMLSARHLRLRMNPDDLSLIETGAGDALRAREVVLQADPAVRRGGCVVESSLGQVDARIDSRWARAVAVFGAPADWGDADDAAPADTAPTSAAPAAELP